MKICGLILVLLLALPAQAQDDDVVRVKSNLASLASGRYQAMIEVKDMVTRKSSKQEAAFDIVP